MRQFHKWSMNWSCNNAPSPKNGAYPNSPSRLAYLPPTSRSERNRASSPLMSRIRPKRPAFTRQAPDDLAGVAQSVPVARRQPRHAVSYRCLRCREPTIFVHAWATRCEKRGNQHRYAEAELLYQRVLAIREKTLGPDDPAVTQRRSAARSLGGGHLSRASAIAVRICDENSALAPDTALEAMEADLA